MSNPFENKMDYAEVKLANKENPPCDMTNLLPEQEFGLVKPISGSNSQLIHLFGFYNKIQLSGKYTPTVRPTYIHTLQIF